MWWQGNKYRFVLFLFLLLFTVDCASSCTAHNSGRRHSSNNDTESEEVLYCDVEDNLDKDGDGEIDTVCGGTDCDDTDASINASVDEDGDGYALCAIEAEDKAADCDDTNPQIHADLATDSGWVRQCAIVEIESLDCDEDQEHRTQPTITKVNGVYEVVFRSCYTNDKRSFGFAYSTDLVTWTESSENPIWGPLKTGWDRGWTKENDAGMSQPWLFYDINQEDYILYFHAKANDDSKRKIGCVTSTDGETYDDWGECDKDDAVLDVGAVGSWDEKTTQGPSVLYDETEETYHMFYSGRNDGGDTVWGMGWATSDDAVTWTKQTVDASLMTNGEEGTWEEATVKFPSVFYDSVMDMYYALYMGEDEDGTSQIGLAYFDEPGDDWTKFDLNPIITNYGGEQWERWDSYAEAGVGNMIMIDENTFLMIYVGSYIPEGEDPEDFQANEIMNIGFAINNRPQITGIEPDYHYVVSMGDAFELSGVIEDDMPSTVLVSFESDLDGDLGIMYPNSDGVFEFTTNSLSIGIHTITIQSLDSGGIYDQANVFVHVK